MATLKKKASTPSKQEDSSFAIAETSGKQVLFQVNRYYDLDRINAKEKEKITLENILLVKEKENVLIGQPFVKNARIELEVVSHKRDKKIIVYKMRPKKKTRKKMGHRQELTRVMVKSITTTKSSSKTKESSSKASSKKSKSS